ncbi:MAG: iron-responsive transcriptional regulator [Bacteroidetes bacterium ADurb.Bin408]|nr:MAG: iron-responsive transcriptional regulator [Bacteroidetes bacterium ADurb.Bin408]
MSKIINISEAATLALHSMALIAGSEKMLNAIDIAQKMHFSKNHLSKVLQMLVRRDYLSSIRGPKGGFRLKKEAQEITLLEIYEIFEGKISSQECAIHNKTACPLLECVFGGLTCRFSLEFENYLKHKKLSELIK